MSEQAPELNHEQWHLLVQAEKALPDAEHAEALRPGEADPLQKLEQARSSAEAVASDRDPIAELNASEQARGAAVTPTSVNRELKEQTRNHQLSRLRRHQSGEGRFFPRHVT